MAPLPTCSALVFLYTILSQIGGKVTDIVRMIASSRHCVHVDIIMVVVVMVRGVALRRGQPGH